jgi:hypothetical protein
VADRAVVQADPAADPATHPVHKMDPAARAGPCIPRGPNPGELPAPADGLVSAPHGPDLAPALDLVRPGLEPVVPVA